MGERGNVNWEREGCEWGVKGEVPEKGERGVWMERERVCGGL